MLMYKLHTNYRLNQTNYEFLCEFVYLVFCRIVAYIRLTIKVLISMVSSKSPYPALYILYGACCVYFGRFLLKTLPCGKEQQTYNWYIN